MAYNFTAIEKKWQHYWLAEQDLPRARSGRSRATCPRRMCWICSPIPAARGCMSGILEGYTATDIVSRLSAHDGLNVLHPDGLGCVRSAGRAVCDQEPTAIRARRLADEHRQLPPADPDAGPELRLGSRGRYHRPGLLQVDAVDLSAAVQQLFRSDRAKGQADRASDQSSW